MASAPKRRGIRITVLLITAIASLVTLSTGLVLFLSARAAFHSTFELLHQSASVTIERLEQDVEVHVAPAKDIVTHFSNLVASGEIDPSNRAQMITAMKSAMGGAPQIAGMVLWDHNNQDVRVLRTPEGLLIPPSEAITDEGFLSNIETIRTAGKPVWQHPAFSRGATYVYAATPLVRDGTFWGVLVTGVSIRALSGFVQRVGTELGMTAFILYGDDAVLAHAELKDMDLASLLSFEKPLLPVSQLKDPVLRGIETAEIEGEAEIENVTVRKLELNDKRYFIMSRQLNRYGATPWHVGVHVPLESIDDQVRRLVWSIFAGLGVLAFAVLCAVVLARYIARPIHTIADAAERVGRFELSDIKSLPRSRIRELDNQAVAFNRMLEGLHWFETYVPKTLVQRLMARGGENAVPSGEMEVTVMFTDIIGFTAMSERMEPAEVADMLNAHFEIIGNCIEAEGGTLDKYIGDAVMAFWGAPERQDDHAERACRAALRIAEEVDRANTKEASHPPIRLKIAIHTGPLLVGNIGAKKRMNYTVIGDTVNTCSRIESLCPKFDSGDGSIILVSADTAKQASGGAGFEFEDAGSFSVKGRRRKVGVRRLTSA